MSNIPTLLLAFGAVFFVVLVILFIYVKSAKTHSKRSPGENRSGDSYGKGAPSN